MKRRMYLFVWENVWTDWTSGIVFCIASSREDALRQARKKWSNSPWRLEDLENTNPLKLPATRRYINGVAGGS